MDYWWATTLNTDSPDTSETTWQPPKLLPLRWRAAETLFTVRVRLCHWAARSLATTRWKLDVRVTQIWRQQHLTSIEFRDTAQCWTRPLRVQPLRMRPSSRRPLREVRRNKTQSIGPIFVFRCIERCHKLHTSPAVRRIYALSKYFHLHPNAWLTGCHCGP